MTAWKREQVPHAVQDAVVRTAAQLYYWRKPLVRLLRKCGAPGSVLDPLYEEGATKVAIVEAVLDDLDRRGAEGTRVQRQIIAALVAVQPDPAQVDVRVAGAAQQSLRAVAGEHGFLARPRERAAEDVEAARAAAEAVRRESAERRRAHAGLRQEFFALAIATGERQRRGYRLEEIVGELARLEGMRWEPPFRKGTVTQTDGLLDFENFRYLIEVRWRADLPDAAALAAFSDKVFRNLDSTRGLFISIAGFRPEVVAEIERGHRNPDDRTGAHAGH